MEKLLIISSELKNNSSGGIETVNTNIIKYLKDRYSIYTYPLNTKNKKSISSTFFENSGLNFSNISELLSHIMNLKSLINSVNPGYVILSTNNFITIIYTIVCSIRKKYKLLWYLHSDFGIAINNFSIPILFKLIVYIFNHFYLKMMSKFVTKICVSSYYMKIFLENKSIHNVSICKLGIDSTYLDLDEFDNKCNYNFNEYIRPIYLVVSRLTTIKNLEAFMNLDIKGTKIVVGDGIMMNRYKIKYKDVIFVGEKTKDELITFYKNADILVFPSKSDVFGLVIIEALYYGIPVAAYKCPNTMEILNKNFLGYCDDDLYIAIKKTLSIPKSSEIIQCRKNYIINNYSWKVCINNMFKDV